MTEYERGVALRDRILTSAPAAILQAVNGDRWCAALLSAEAYFKMSGTKYDTDDVIKYWTQGCFGNYIAKMFDLTVQEVHDQLVEYGFHAPYHDDYSYSIETINTIVAERRKLTYTNTLRVDKSMTREISDKVVATYKNEEDMLLQPVTRPAAPKQCEIHVIKELYMEGAPLTQISTLSHRTDAEIAFILSGEGIKIVNDSLIEQAYKCGKWISFIALMYGLQVDDVKKRLQALGYPIPKVSHGEFGLMDLNKIASGDGTDSELAQFYKRECEDMTVQPVISTAVMTHEEIDTINRLSDSGYSLQHISEMCNRTTVTIERFRRSPRGGNRG